MNFLNFKKFFKNDHERLSEFFRQGIFKRDLTAARDLSWNQNQCLPLHNRCGRNKMSFR